MSNLHISPKDARAMRIAMYWSLGIGLLMLVIKVSAFVLTGSAAILSDAAESVVHVLAVSFAVYSFRYSLRPPDATHLYGHEKISFLSAGFEGGMIVLAAFYIIYEAINRWLGGLALDNLGTGTLLTAAAAAINGALGGYLLWLGRRNKSLILEANGKHVLTDSWTSLGVLVGLGLTLYTGWLPWDPICAIAVAVNILVSGFNLISRSASGLLDSADLAVQQRAREMLEEAAAKFGVEFHALRHRDMGNTLWMEFHLLFPDEMSVKEAHRIATAVENYVAEAMDRPTYVTTHLEAIEDHEKAHQHSGHGV
ncbi:MAG TPA: cation diffusion facilitator family transporter [Calditrichia bacterium]|nr:cation diffusion facilitator family transporter [Calditrichia bacterium]